MVGKVLKQLRDYGSGTLEIMAMPENSISRCLLALERPMLLLVCTPGGCFIPFAFRSPGWAHSSPSHFPGSRVSEFHRVCFPTCTCFPFTSMRADRPGSGRVRLHAAAFLAIDGFSFPLIRAPWCAGIPFLYLPFASSSCPRSARGWRV